MTGNRQLKKQTRELLGGLGSCRAEVAGTLRGVGVRAVPKDPRDCAVAIYLGAVLGADTRIKSLAVQSGDVKVLVEEPKWFHLPNVVRVQLPKAVRQFIEAFDQAVYPDLIREGCQRSAKAKSPVS